MAGSMDSSDSEAAHSELADRKLKTLEHLRLLQEQAPFDVVKLHQSNGFVVWSSESETIFQGIISSVTSRCTILWWNIVTLRRSSCMVEFVT
jgi:hypothetical protein